MLRIFIGFDKAEIAAYNVCAYSIIKHSSKPVSITPLNIRQLGFLKNTDYKASTEFAFSRFLVPYLSNYEGWSLFMDCDMLVREDINELFSLADDQYSVMCVKHQYRPKMDDKFLGQVQTQYEKKNWSSVMLFNNAKCKNLTPDFVNKASGLVLHQFEWADKVGPLPKSWNYLVGENVEPQPDVNLVHYTRGGPYFKEYEHCQYGDEWFKYFREANSVLDRRVVSV